jgi:acyl-CoA thioesterase
MSTPFTSVLAALEPDGQGFSVEAPLDWLQGRTAYGGLSGALCYEAATRSVPELPPLRSAQFGFAGPATGRLRIEPTVLRQGRSTTFIGVDVIGEAGLAVRGLLCFGVSRASSLERVDIPAPTVQGWDDCPPFFVTPARPTFSSHFDSRIAGGARPRTPGEDPAMLVWLRHHDVGANAHMAGLVALTDALPPAAMVMFPPEPAPVSTMTWTLDVLTESPASASGWWLVENVAQVTREGYSAQAMMVWNDEGAPVVAMRQTVAIFV